MAEIKGVSITATTVKELKKTIDELRGSLIQLSSADENYSRKVQELQAHQAKLNEVMALTSKATMEEVKAVSAVANSYDALVAKGALLRKEWRAMEIGSPDWERHAEEIMKVNEQLKAHDARIGNYQRNVGNYAGAIAPLQFQINQLVREVPSLTNSANQFFMAISNNLPMFADEIVKLRKANAELASQGKPTVSILKQIVTGLFSWQTALVVVISLLAKFGGSIAEFISDLTGTKDPMDEAREAMEKYNEAIEDIEQNSENLDAEVMVKYADKLKNAKGDIDTMKTALKEYNDELERNTEANYLKKIQEAEQAIKTIEEQKRNLEKELENKIANHNKYNWNETDTEKELWAKAARWMYEDDFEELDKLTKQAQNNLADLQNDYTKWQNKPIIENAEAQVKEAEQTAEKIAQKTAEEARKGEEAIAKMRQKIADSKLDEYQREEEEATRTYQEMLAIYQRYGEDTTELTEFYNKQIANINKKRQDAEKKESEERKKRAIEEANKIKETKQKALEKNIDALKQNSQESLRYTQLTTASEEQKAKRIFDIGLKALQDERNLLQQGLDDNIYFGEKEIEVKERIAQIDRDIAFKTAEYKSKVEEKEYQAKKKRNDQWVQLSVSAASATSSILGSIADMYESSGEENEEATKKAKNLRIAGATMDMLGGIVSAWASALNPANAGATIWGQIAMAGITSATMLATGIANIAKIRNTDTSGNSSSGSSSAVVPAPAIVQQVPITRTLTGVEEEERLNQSQRVYVVYDDIAQVGRKVDVTESEATF